MIRFALILIGVFAKSLFGCTIFSVNQDETSVLAANNCDSSYRPSQCMHIEPGNDLKYGAIYFGSPNYEQCGLNEHGLFYANATIPEWPEKNYQPIGMTYTEDIRKKIMQECKTVEEAIKLVTNAKSHLFINHHTLIADRTGKSAIIEWDGNKLNIIRKKNNYQIATNFILSDIENYKHISCNRYITANKQLSAQDMSIETCKNILDLTHAHNTMYSIIADLKKGIIYLYLDHDYNNFVKIYVIDEINKNINPVSSNLSSLFKEKND